MHKLQGSNLMCAASDGLVYELNRYPDTPYTGEFTCNHEDCENLEGSAPFKQLMKHSLLKVKIGLYESIEDVVKYRSARRRAGGEMEVSGQFVNGLADGEWSFVTNFYKRAGSHKEHFDHNCEPVPLVNWARRESAYSRVIQKWKHQGNETERINLQAGRKHGEHSITSTLYPTDKLVCNYDNGSISGLLEIWESGVRIYEIPFLNDKKNGLCVSRYSNGKDKSLYTMINGKMNGEYISHYETGQNCEEGKYVDGKKVGIWQYWLEDGTLTVEDDETRFNIKSNKKKKATKRKKEKMQKILVAIVAITVFWLIF